MRGFSDVTTQQHGGLFEQPQTFHTDTIISKQLFLQREILVINPDSRRHYITQVQHTISLDFPFNTGVSSLSCLLESASYRTETN